MRKVLLTLLVLIPGALFAQSGPDELLGKWMNIPKKSLEIEIYKSGEEYEGKISWCKDNDPKKPVGFVILRDLRYDAEEKQWTDGTVVDPNSGSSYSATAKMEEDGTLNVHAYKGFKFLGKTKNFKRSDISR